MSKITIDRSVLELSLNALATSRIRNEAYEELVKCDASLASAERERLETRAEEAAHNEKLAHNEAYESLRAALAQPQQEPVAEVETVWLDKSKATVIVMHGRFLQRGDKLYASPARKPLTVEQIKNCLDAADQMHCERDGDKEVFKARAIEAAAHGITA